MKQVHSLLQSLENAELPNVLCLHDDHWHQCVVGLVASRVKDAVHRPVFAFAPESDGADVLKGSARSVRGLHIRDALALTHARHPELIDAFGGHAMAAGLTIRRDALDSLRDALNASVDEMLDGAALTEEILTDGELEPRDIGLGLARLIVNHGPWGQRFPEPLFDGWFEVIDRRVVGGSHLKMIVRPHSGGMEIDAIAFGRMPQDLPESGPVRLLYRLGVNRWRGQESPQLLVEHLLSD